jgi:hypothetical protein
LPGLGHPEPAARDQLAPAVGVDVDELGNERERPLAVQPFDMEQALWRAAQLETLLERRARVPQREEVVRALLERVAHSRRQRVPLPAVDADERRSLVDVAAAFLLVCLEQAARSRVHRLHDRARRRPLLLAPPAAVPLDEQPHRRLLLAFLRSA